MNNKQFWRRSGVMDCMRVTESVQDLSKSRPLGRWVSEP